MADQIVYGQTYTKEEADARNMMLSVGLVTQPTFTDLGGGTSKSGR